MFDSLCDMDYNYIVFKIEEKRGAIFVKKLITALLAIALVFAFTACNNNEGDDSAENTENLSKLSEFTFVVNGVTVTPGKVMPSEKLPEPKAISKVPSVAFEGTDDVYFFGDFEITAHVENGENEVYSVNFINSAVSTAEGLKLGDTKEKMIELYGENYEINNKECLYKGEINELCVIIRDNVVTSIEIKRTV